MEIPDDVISLIHDYSRPVTRPDWRTLHRMTDDMFHLAAMAYFNPSFYNFVSHFPFNRKACYEYKVLNNMFYYTTK